MIQKLSQKYSSRNERISNKKLVFFSLQSMVSLESVVSFRFFVLLKITTKANLVSLSNLASTMIINLD